MTSRGGCGLLIGSVFASHVEIFFADAAPGAAIASEQFIGFGRTPGAGGGIWEVARGEGVRDVENGLDDAPAGFNHVGAVEESGVAGHAVAKEAFVAGAVFGAEIRVVVKIHIDEAETHDGAGNFCAEAERDAFIGLDVDDHAIGFDVFDRGVTEKNKGSAAKLHDDFGGALREALAGAEVEGNARPAPVVDQKFQGNEGLGVGLRIDVGFFAVARELFAVHFTRAVLAANRVGEDFFGAERLDGVKDFGLLVAAFIGVEGDGRLHGGHGEELEKMIWDHVAESAGGFVEAATMLDADGFGGGDLDVVDVVAIPKGFDDVVRKAKDHDVLNGFFAEVMVDAVDLLFSENFFEVVVELDSGLQIVVKGFFDDDAGPLAVFFFRHSCRAKLLDDGGEKARGDGEVEEIVAAATVVFVNDVDLNLEALVGVGIGEIAGDEIDALDEPVPHLEIDGIGGELRDFGGQRLAEGLRGEIASSHADDGEMLGQNLFLRKVEQGGGQLALGEVSGGHERTLDKGRGGAGSLSMIRVHGARSYLELGRAISGFAA